MLLSVDLNGCIQVLNKGYFPKLFFRRFWLLRRNNVITTTDIKQLKPYMYQLISFKIILHLHLLVKLSMQVVFVSRNLRTIHGWRVFTQGTRGFFLHVTRSFIRPREKTSGADRGRQEFVNFTCPVDRWGSSCTCPKHRSSCPCMLS